MINILSSRAGSRSNDFVEAKRKTGQDNLAWLSDNAAEGTDHTTLVMVGGKSQTSFRLRVAQCHVRSDLLPSYWSHVMLLDKPAKSLGSTRTYEISLEPRGGFGFPAPDNGVQTGKLSDYANAETYPNIALLTVPVTLKEVLESLAKFKKQRAVLDGVDLIVRWLAYAWGVARSPNPLLDGLGVPSSAMLEIVVGTCGFDLTPGSRVVPVVRKQFGRPQHGGTSTIEIKTSAGFGEPISRLIRFNSGGTVFRRSRAREAL